GGGPPGPAASSCWALAECRVCAPPREGGAGCRKPRGWARGEAPAVIRNDHEVIGLRFSARHAPLALRGTLAKPGRLLRRGTALAFCIFPKSRGTTGQGE